MASFMDISERKTFEKHLRESEAHFRSLFDDSPAALMEVDASGTVQYAESLKESGVTDLERYIITPAIKHLNTSYAA
jgi:hypothetical protein